MTMFTRRSLIATGLAALTPTMNITRIKAQTAPTIMKLGTPTLNDGQHEFLKRFSAEVEKRSDGRIKGEVYPASQLGPTARQIEAVQLSAIQGFIAPAEFYEGVDPRFQVLTAPGLFADMDHVDRVAKDREFRNQFYQVGNSCGLLVSSVFLSGPTAINSRTPVKEVSDFKNLKIRVLASPMQTDPLKALGASPVPISLGDVLPALQQGTIDGVMSVLPVLTAMRYYEAARFFTETDFSMTVSCFTLSKNWVNRLSPELRTIVTEAASRIGDEMHPWVVNFYQKQRVAWAAGGGSVLTIPKEERAKTMAALDAVAADVVKEKPAVKDMYAIVKQAAERTGAA
jgi:TRAP-type C4-dicarboxylate transport system substrate-binding protein